VRHYNTDYDRHDPLGWLKTLGLVVVVFALVIGTGIMAAKANTCAPSCRDRHNQCRLQTKGAPSCDAQLQACLQSCLAAPAATKK
jgi:hypothetical protein